MEETYDKNVNLWKKAYTEILEVCKKYHDFDNKFSFRDMNDMRKSAESHLTLIEWYEKYGLKLSHDYKPAQNNYFKHGSYGNFSHFGDAQKEKDSGNGGRYISWPDDDRQPMNEWLFNISFPTGAYIFGDDYDYQQDLFQDFIGRLKSYKPDYSDTVNKSFYWKLENAKPIVEEFNGIYQEFQEKNKQEFDKRKADKLRKQLAELESKSE